MANRDPSVGVLGWGSEENVVALGNVSSQGFTRAIILVILIRWRNRLTLNPHLRLRWHYDLERKNGIH